MSGLINIGFGNAVNTAKVVAVINPDAAPVKRMVSHAREEGRIIDATQGRRTKAVIVTQEDHIILSALQPDTIARRFSGKRDTRRQLMNKKGILIVLSGFSGVGKGTVVKRLLSDYDNYVLSISATTRKPREGEEEGISYFFKSKEDFEQMIKDDAFVEHARYVDNYYGTPKAYVQEQLDAGKDVILEIEIQGALKVKEKYPDALMLFLVPPDARTLKERLIGRGTETAEVIHDRLKRAAQEAQEMGSYEYIIVNDDLDTCVKQVHALIQSAHCKKSHNTEFIKELQQDMNCFLKGE